MPHHRFQRFDFNSILNNKSLDMPKLKAFADDKINATQKLKFELGRVKNIVGKGENASYQHFFLFPRFQQASCIGSLKVVIVWQRVNLRNYSFMQIPWSALKSDLYAL